MKICSQKYEYLVVQKLVQILFLLALSAGAIEYTDCISAEVNPPSLYKCPRYDTKQSDGEALVLGLL